jgi:hypothetical protein
MPPPHTSIRAGPVAADLPAAHDEVDPGGVHVEAHFEAHFVNLQIPRWGHAALQSFPAGATIAPAFFARFPGLMA